MASNAFLGFTKGFFETQNQMIDKEQERRDRIGDAIVAMQLKGAEKRMTSYEDRKANWDVINQMKADNPQLAMIKWAETVAGIDPKSLNQSVLSKYSKEELNAALENSYNSWKAGPVPTISEEDTQAPHMRRAADDSSIGSLVKSMFGIDSNEIPYTPYAGIKKMSEKEAIGIAEREQMQKLMEQQEAGKAVEGGPAKYLELATEGKKGDFRTLTSSTGEDILVDVRRREDGGYDVIPVTRAEPTKLTTNLGESEKVTITSKLQNTKSRLKDGDIRGVDEDLGENLVELIGTETNPGVLQGAIYERILVARKADERLTIDQAYNVAFDDIVKAARMGAVKIIEEDWSLGTKPVWRDRMPVRDKNTGEIALLPWYALPYLKPYQEVVQ